jgi:hypothetical protein
MRYMSAALVCESGDAGHFPISGPPASPEVQPRGRCGSQGWLRLKLAPLAQRQGSAQGRENMLQHQHGGEASSTADHRMI